MLIILIVIGLIILAYIMRNPGFLGFVLKSFLFIISFLTPFWPIVLVAFYLQLRLKKDE